MLSLVSSNDPGKVVQPRARVALGVFVLVRIKENMGTTQRRYKMVDGYGTTHGSDNSIHLGVKTSLGRQLVDRLVGATFCSVLDEGGGHEKRAQLTILSVGPS